MRLSFPLFHTTNNAQAKNLMFFDKLLLTNDVLCFMIDLSKNIKH